MSVIRYRVISKYIGGVLVVLGGSLLLNAAVIILLGEGHFVFHTVFGLVVAGAGLFLSRRVPEKDVTGAEVASIASLSFLIASLVGAVPFFFFGDLSLMDAWFEAMSGFTTTGFSMIDVGTAPRSLLFSRALQQWLGGLGFVAITVSLFIISGRPAVTLLKETGKEKVAPRIAKHLHVIIITYLLFTAFGILLFCIFGIKPFDAVCYTLAGISTGGFASRTGSAGILPGARAFVPFLVIMVLGATNFVSHYRVWKASKTWKDALLGMIKNPQTRLLLVMIAAAGVLAGAGLTGKGRWLNGLFLAASAQTTTGFYLHNVPADLSEAAMMVLVVSMLVGGSMGSTAGGIKLHRIIQLYKGLVGFLTSRLYPRERVLPPHLRVSEEAKEELVGISYVITLYLVCIFVAGLILVWHGYGPLESIFEVTSAASTVGLSSGIVSPELPVQLKVLFILMMWAGRLEFLPLFVWGYSFGAAANSRMLRKP